MLQNQYDLKIKNAKNYDWSVSNNSHYDIRPRDYPSKMNKGSFYRTTHKDYKNTNLCYSEKFIDIQSTTPIPSVFQSSGQYFDFKISPVKNALFKSCLFMFNLTNTNSSSQTASLYSTPLMFQQVRVLKGQSTDIGISYYNHYHEYITNCLNLKDPYSNWAEFGYYGLLSTGAFTSNNTITAGSSSTLYFNCNNSLTNTYIPLNTLSKNDVSIRLIPQTSILWPGASSNVTLSQLQLNWALLRVFYVETDDEDWSVILSSRKLSYNSLVPKYETWTISSLAANTPMNNQINSITGLVLAFFVFITTPGSQLDLFNYSGISSIYLTNSNNVAIFNLSQNLAVSDLKLIAGKQYGGNYFLSSSTQGVLSLPPFSSNMKSVFKTNRHESPYLLTSDDIHNLVLISNTTLTNVQLNLVCFTAGSITAGDDGISEVA